VFAAMVVVLIVQAALPERGLTRLVLLANVVLAALAPPAVFAAIRGHTRVTLRTVLGALSVYLLLGLFFALVARALAQFDSTAYQAPEVPIEPAAFQYFSFDTLTTVGYGDMVPTTEVAGPWRWSKPWPASCTW
jgi:hypothetical protein